VPPVDETVQEPVVEPELIAEKPESVGEPEPVPQEPEQQVLLTEEGTPVAQAEPDWRMAGEVLDTYIIVEQGERVFFIDKHAAHERMNFEKLKARDYQPMSQLLLTPLTLNPPPEEGAALLAHRELLQRFGFELEDFGGGALLVRQVPDYLSVGQVEQTLSELAQRLMVTGTADPAAARDEVLHTMACKSAIKGGWKNDRRELQAVAEAVMSGAVRYCPHGRPVAIELTKKQLEKQFKRT
jgi:DNA mismatch repair protein MutL